MVDKIHILDRVLQTSFFFYFGLRIVSVSEFFGIQVMFISRQKQMFAHHPRIFIFVKMIFFLKRL